MRFAERCVPAAPGSAGAVLRRWAPSRRRTRVGFARGCSPTASGPDPRPPHCGSRSRRCWSPARPVSTGNRRRRQRGSAPLRPAPRHIVSRTRTQKKNPKSFCAKAKGGARVRSSPPAAPGPPCPPPCSAPAPRCAPPFPAQTVLWGQISFPAFAQRQFRDSVRCFKAVFENVRPFKIVMKSKRLLINGKRWKGSEAAKRHLTVPQTSVDAGGIPADTGAGGAHPTAAPGRAGTGQPHRR